MKRHSLWSKKYLSMLICFAFLVSIFTGFIGYAKVEASVNPGAREMPGDYFAANQDLPRRLGMNIEYMVQDSINNPLEFSPRHGNSYFGSNIVQKDYYTNFPRMLSNLISMKLWDKGSATRAKYNLVTDVRNDMPQIIEDWTDNILIMDGIGTSMGFKNDFDMKLKEIIEILYYMKDSEDSAYLTDNAVHNLIVKCFTERAGSGGVLPVEYYGTSMKHMVAPVPARAYYNPETENHVIMIYSSFYLMNQYITNDYRNIQSKSFKNGTFGDYVSDFENTLEFEEFMLNIIQRSVHSDYFELNSRSYLGHTIYPLFTLYKFADSQRIKQACKNAIDTIAAKFAFMSLEGKRYTPQRRSSNADKYLYDIGLYKGDGAGAMMAMISGGYVWNDYFQSWNNDHEAYGIPFKEYAAYSIHAGLASVNDNDILGDNYYTIPKQIHQFFLDKQDGYWARFMSRSGDDYEGFVNLGNPDNDNIYANHFEEDGFRIVKDMSFTPEAYFVTNNFMHVMGGNFHDQVYDDGPGTSHFYNGLTKFTSIIPKGDISDWGSTKLDEAQGYQNMSADVFHLKSFSSDHEFWNENNVGTYKNFSYGISVISPGDWSPVNIPSRFVENESNHMEFSSNSNTNNPEAVYYKIFDLTGYAEDCWLVTGYMSNHHDLNVYGGFMEIIPKDRFVSLFHLRNHLLAYNSDEDVIDRESGAYHYKLITGEELTLERPETIYSTHESRHIRKILDSNGNELNPYFYYFQDKLDDNNLNYPLMDVRAVDASYNFTGERYAYSRGNGLIQIYNPDPLMGQDKYYIIDSRNIYAPYTMSSSEAQITNNINMTGYNSDYRGIAVTIKTHPGQENGQPWVPQGDAGTTDYSILQIKYTKPGSSSIFNRNLQITRTKSGDATTLYFYPPEGKIERITSMKIIKLPSNYLTNEPFGNDGWYVKDISVEYQGQTVYTKAVNRMLNNTSDAAVEENILPASPALGRVKVAVLTGSQTDAGSNDYVSLYIKKKDGSTVINYLGQLGKNQTYYFDTFYMDFSLNNIAEVGLSKMRSNFDYPTDDNLRVSYLMLYTANTTLYYNGTDFNLTNPQNFDPYAYFTFPVNYSNAPREDKITESAGTVRIDIRTEHDSSWFEDPNTIDPLYLKVNYSNGESQEELISVRGGFSNSKNFEDSHRDLATSVILRNPRHTITSVQLRKVGDDYAEVIYFRLWMDAKKVFEKKDFDMDDNQVRIWDTPNGL